MKDLKRELNVIVDNENLLRCEGRLQYAPLPYDSKTPILLNDKHRLALARLKHTLNELRQRFWIVRERNFVRGVVRICLVCRRFEVKTCHHPITPPVTPLRLNDSAPFVTTSIDKFGPVHVKNVYGQSDKTYKSWVTLYTCATSRGIILDLIPGMDPSVLKRSIKSFISR